MSAKGNKLTLSKERKQDLFRLDKVETLEKFPLELGIGINTGLN